MVQPISIATNNVDWGVSIREVKFSYRYASQDKTDIVSTRLTKN